MSKQLTALLIFILVQALVFQVHSAPTAAALNIKRQMIRAVHSTVCTIVYLGMWTNGHVPKNPLKCIFLINAVHINRVLGQVVNQ
jgi:hypothetical protein